MKRICVALLVGIVGCASVESVLVADAASEKVVYSFGGGTDGQAPSTGVIDVKGTLYGTTTRGGDNNGCEYGCGTVFALDPKTGVEKVLYAFCSQENCTDGSLPSSGLIDVKDILFGATESGGGTGCYGYGCGTVFAVEPSTGAEKVLYSFCSLQNCADGSEPNSLIDVKGTLYGTTGYGGGTGCGGNGCGTVFAFDSKSGAEKVVYSFCSQQNCTDGAYPVAGLVDVDGTLYGTTYFGGVSCTNSSGCGTVFALDPKTGTEKVLYSFCSQPSCADGENPKASLINVKGTLYGTTYLGGTGCLGNGCGTVFGLNLKTGAERVLYSFCSQYDCPDGDNPEGSLIDVKGTLYGTTYFGGDSISGSGVAFAIDPKTGTETVLYSFCSQQSCADGNGPEGNLIDVKGTLYGTAYYGGANCTYPGGCGVVFALKP